MNLICSSQASLLIHVNYSSDLLWPLFSSTITEISFQILFLVCTLIVAANLRKVGKKNLTPDKQKHTVNDELGVVNQHSDL